MGAFHTLDFLKQLPRFVKRIAVPVASIEHFSGDTARLRGLHQQLHHISTSGEISDCSPSP